MRLRTVLPSAASSSSDKAALLSIQGLLMADGKGASAIFCSQCDSGVFQKITLSHGCDMSHELAKGKPSISLKN